MKSANRTAHTRQLRILSAGQGLVEYALLLALVAVLAISAVVYVGGQAGSTLSNVADGLNGAPAVSGAPAPQPTAVNPDDYSTRKTCKAAGYTWIAKTKAAPAHCQ